MNSVNTPDYQDRDEDFIFRSIREYTVRSDPCKASGFPGLRTYDLKNKGGEDVENPAVGTSAVMNSRGTFKEFHAKRAYQTVDDLEVPGYTRPFLREMRGKSGEDGLTRSATAGLRNSGRI